MTTTETATYEFCYFSPDEERVIEDFLRSRGHTWGHNTVCGNCCDMFEDTYWVNGIGGKWPKQDKDDLRALLSERGITALIDEYGNGDEGYRIEAVCD